MAPELGFERWAEGLPDDEEVTILDEDLDEWPEDDEFYDPDDDWYFPPTIEDDDDDY